MNLRVGEEVISPERGLDRGPAVNQAYAQYLQRENNSIKILHYLDSVEKLRHFALVIGKPVNGSLVRIHSECLTGDVFGSERCDCGPQLNAALCQMLSEGAGVLVYLRQEGRGIGLANKLKAYQLQEQGRDTVEANLELGFAADLRSYGAAARILADLGLNRLRLLTNNPKKLISLVEFGLEDVERVALAVGPNSHNRAYLEAKRRKLGHLLPKLD